MIAICLCAGVIINVAVAWGLAVLLTVESNSVVLVDGIVVYSRSPKMAAQFTSFSRSGGEWRGWRIAERFRQQGDTMGYRVMMLGDDASPPPIRLWGALPSRLASGEAEGEERLEYAAGWPMLALSYERVWRDSGRVLRWGVQLSDPNSAAHIRALPLRPIWPGLLANSSLYATAIFLPWIAFLMLRVLHRLRHGRCPQCAYDLRFDLASGCPECSWRREGAQGSQSVTIERGAAT